MSRRSRTGSHNCGLCGIHVDSKYEHLKYVHGWVDCGYCKNSMERSSLENHLKQKHNKQMLGLVASVTRALESQKDQTAVATEETKAKTCCHCKAKVPAMGKHLEKIHGYVRCKVCNELMPADSVTNHSSRLHGQNSIDNKNQDLKIPHDNEITKIQSERPKIDVPKSQLNWSWEEFPPPFDTKLPSITANLPPVDSSNIYDIVTEKNTASFINEPQTSSVANVEGTYFNTISISDKELNKLMAQGRIGSQQGQLFLRDS